MILSMLNHKADITNALVKLYPCIPAISLQLSSTSFLTKFKSVYTTFRNFILIKTFLQLDITAK